MAAIESANKGTTSTTWAWRQVKIRRPAGGQQHSTAKPSRWFGRARRDPREPLTLTIKYRGGEECWYEVHARGEVGRFPGHVALHDVLREVNQLD